MAENIEDKDETRIFINDAQARAMLDKISAYDAEQDARGKVNLTRSAIVAFKVRLDDIGSTPAGRKWLKAYDEAQAQKAGVGNA